MYKALLLRSRAAPPPIVTPALLPLSAVFSKVAQRAPLGLFVALIALAITGCNETKMGEDQTERDGSSSPRLDEQSKIDIVAEPSWPIKSSAGDRALMSRWLEENELCRGSTDTKTIEAMCARREQTGNLLERRGWCYAYEDDTVFPADYRWHSCAEKTLPTDLRTQHLDDQARVDFNAKATNHQIFDSRHQAREDARAAVRESWVISGKTIGSIVVGYKCRVIDQLSANLAVQKIQSRMQDELWHAGVEPDSTSTAEIEKITANSVASGEFSAENGACDWMTPASRGRLRSLVAALI